LPGITEVLLLAHECSGQAREKTCLKRQAGRRGREKGNQVELTREGPSPTAGGSE